MTPTVKTNETRDETRDRGVALAIEAAGGVGPLARKLGISQPSVSGWSRIPAERVAAVEAATGIARSRLRPDLFAANDDIHALHDPMGEARAQEYLLLSALLVAPPTQALLDQVATIKGDVTTLGMAHIGLADAAMKTSEAAAGAEYFRLFVGVGRGELLPYGSYYLSGFLNERPLVRLRQDLARLGVERAEGVFEPEDHIATEFEVMAGLIVGRIPGGDAEADAFFRRHLAPWARRFFTDLRAAEGSGFYRAVAELGLTWIDIETAALDLSR